MTVTVVPYEDPDQSEILYQYLGSPYSAGWWQTQTITEIPGDAVGWMVAQGWQITDVPYVTDTVPKTAYFDMKRDSLQNWQILQGLLVSWTDAHNLANANNTIRYNDIVEDWTEMITSTQTHFTTQVTEQNTHVTDYLADVDTYMDTVEALVQASDYETDIDAVLALLVEDYDLHDVTAKGFLTGLGATELARINEKYAATRSVQLQQLTDRGLYSSAIASGITARNVRDREEEIGTLNDRLNREKLANQHQLYEQQQSMRDRTLAGQSAIRTDKHQAVSELMTTYARRLDGSAAKHAENMVLTQYQLQVRNELLVGLYGFVERRDDVAPAFNDLIQITTGLGDVGGSWISP